MRKLKKSRHSKREFREENEKKRFSWPSIFALVAIVIMTASGIGYMWGEGNSMTYKSHKFEKTNEGWTTKLGGVHVKFYVLPQEAEPIKIDKAAIDTIKSTRMIYLTSDLDSPFSDVIGLMSYELKNEFQKKGLYSVTAFTTSNNYTKEIVTCRNATQSVPVLYLTNLNETSITFDNNCITMGSNSGYEFRAARDRLLYGFFGVIE